MTFYPPHKTRNVIPPKLDLLEQLQWANKLCQLPIKETTCQNEQGDIVVDSRFNYILFKSVTFSSTDFSGLHLYRVKFFDCKFLNCTFANTLFFDQFKHDAAQFKRCVFEAGYWRGANLSRCDFFMNSINCTFNGAILSRAHFRSCKFLSWFPHKAYHLRHHVQFSLCRDYLNHSLAYSAGRRKIL